MIKHKMLYLKDKLFPKSFFYSQSFQFMLDYARKTSFISVD